MILARLQTKETNISDFELEQRAKELAQLLRIGRGAHHTRFYKQTEFRFYEGCVRSLIHDGLLEKISVSRDDLTFRLTPEGEKLYRSIVGEYTKRRQS